MSFNKRNIKVESTAKKLADPKDIIVDPKGQWKHPGKITKIPSNNITMKGVPYPVYGVDDLGNSQIMFPNEDYIFPGSSVTEYPIIKDIKSIEKNLQNTVMKKNNIKKGGEPFPTQPTAEQFFSMGFIPESPVAFYKKGGDVPCMNCGGSMQKGGENKDMVKDFQMMAKKQFGGNTENVDQDDYLANYNNTFKSAIKNNIASNIAVEAANQMQNMMAQYGQEINYGYVGNPMGDMYSAKADFLDQNAQSKGQNFFNTSFNAMATANPYMKYSMPKAQLGDADPTKAHAWEDSPNYSPDVKNGSNNIQNQFAQWLKMMNQNKSSKMNPSFNNQSQWSFNSNPMSRPQGNPLFPMNSNPNWNWNTNQNANVPTFGFNPENTYLQSLDYKGRMFGQGPRKVSMTFRTYIDPTTGQTKQIPADDAWDKETLEMTKDREMSYGGMTKAQDGLNLNQNTNDYFDTTITGKRKMGLDGEAAANWMMAGVDGLTGLLNKNESFKTNEEVARMTLADNQFQAMPANRIQNQGRYNWTGMSDGMMDPNSMVPVQQPGQNFNMEGYAFSRYGGMMQEGGAVELSEDEINYILANGGSIEYLD